MLTESERIQEGLEEEEECAADVKETQSKDEEQLLHQQVDNSYYECSTLGHDAAVGFTWPEDDFLICQLCH